jgi:sRNA-binding regulator protein Hfq
MVNEIIWCQIKSGVHLLLGLKLHGKLSSNDNFFNMEY